MLNSVDILILLVFVVVISVGFFSGVSRLTAALLGIYFASIVATAFYVNVADAAREQIPTMGVETAYLFFFILLFLVFAALFAIVFAKWLSGLTFPRRTEILDNIGGAALGVLVSALAVTLAATLLVVILQAVSQTMAASGDGTTMGKVNAAINQSTLVPVFLEISPYFVKIVSPWFPNGLPPILSGAMEA
jgi:uncharacterized membrane protein required for colicin V production